MFMFMLQFILLLFLVFHLASFVGWKCEDTDIKIKMDCEELALVALLCEYLFSTFLISSTIIIIIIYLFKEIFTPHI